MALDPMVEQVLGWARRSRQPSFVELGAVGARAAYERAAVVLDTPPAPVASVGEHEVRLPGRTLRVREYVPRPHHWGDPMPALLFFHGGGFTIGSLETHDRLCRMLCLGGDCIVYAVHYRLAPEHRFPAAADDAFDTLAWLRSEAASLAVDSNRIAVGGDSAGGTLAAAAALHARDRGWPLALQLLVYPGLSPSQDTDSHRRLARGFLLDADVIQWFFSMYLADDQYRQDWRFAPLVAESLAGVAPAWIALAEFDPLLDEGAHYARRLREAGVPVQLRVYEGLIHGFMHHAGLVQRAAQARSDAGQALYRALHPDHF